jgi:hypothetical protein
MLGPPRRRVRLLRTCDAGTLSRVPNLPQRDGATLPAGDVLAAVGDALDAGRGRVLKEAGRVRVVALSWRELDADDDGRDADSVAPGVVVKIVRSPNVLRRVFERLDVAPSKLLRQWRGAELLRGADIAVAEPIVLGRGTDHPGRRVDALVMMHAAGRSVIELAARADEELTPADRRGAAHAVGRATRRLADAGLTNRDHKPSNLLAEWPSANDAAPSDFGWFITFIDTVGIERDSGRRDVAALLFNLLVECVGSGVRLSRTDRMRVLHAAFGWCRQRGLAAGGSSTGEPDSDAAPPPRPGDAARKQVRDYSWAIIDRRLRRHGEPTPADDPLRPSGLPGDDAQR